MIDFKQFVLTEEYELEPHSQKGSNPGGIYTHKRTGSKIYAKFPHNIEQAKVEVATADLYKQLGIRTVNPEIKTVVGRSAITSSWHPNLHQFSHENEMVGELKNEHRAKEFAMMHHAAVITGNRDIVGLGYDNILKDKETGELVSVDQGGSMHFRAQGMKKPFEKNIDEVEAFQNPHYASGRVFGNLDPKHLADAAKDLHKLTDAKIDAIMKPHKLDYLSDVIKARRDMLISHYRQKETGV